MKLSRYEIEQHEKTKEGRAYLEYNEKVGGEPIGLTIPFGYPEGVKEKGGVVKVYQECIRKGVTWEELLNYEEDPDVDI